MSKQVFVYPDENRHERWEREADSRDMSMSVFIQNMVEAGLKNFDARVEPDKSVTELREQRNRLRGDLDRARDRIESLENRLDTGVRAKIKEYVEDNPGAGYAEIHQHVLDNSNEMVTRSLEMMESESLTVDEDDNYYIFD